MHICHLHNNIAGARNKGHTHTNNLYIHIPLATTTTHTANHIVTYIHTNIHLRETIHFGSWHVYTSTWNTNNQCTTPWIKGRSTCYTDSSTVPDTFRPLPAVLGWLGDGDYYLMESGGWPYPHETGRRSSDIVSRVTSLYSVCSPFPFDISFTCRESL